MEFTKNRPELSNTSQEIISGIESVKSLSRVEYADNKAAALAEGKSELVERIYSIVATGDGGKITKEHIEWADWFVGEYAFGVEK